MMRRSYAYTISSNGMLSANGTSNTVASGVQPYTAAADPKGQYLYVADEFAGTLSQSLYRHRIYGTLTPMSPASIAAGTFPGSCSWIRPALVYVTNSGDNTVAQYAIGADGTLSADRILRDGVGHCSVTYT